MFDGAQHSTRSPRATRWRIDLDERARLAGAGRSPDQRDVTAAHAGVDRGALRRVERGVERGPRRRRERAGRASERADLAEPREIGVRECRLRARDRGVSAIERQLGCFGIERVLAVDLVDGAVEHQPQALLFAALEHAADRAGLVGLLGP